MRRGMGLTAIALLVAFASGCAYNVQPSSVSAINVYSPRSDKVPGTYALVIDESLANVRREVRPSSYVCAAHTYPLAIGEALAQSIRGAVRQTVAEVEESRGGTTAGAGRSGTIVFRLDDFQPRLTCSMGFFSGTCTGTAELSISMTVRNPAGAVVLNTAASSSRSADADAGAACGSGGESLSQAFSRATRDVLERLMERLAHSNLGRPG